MSLDTPSRGRSSQLPVHASTARLQLAPEVLFVRSRTTLLVGRRKALAPVGLADARPVAPAQAPPALPSTKRNAFEPAGALRETMVGLGSFAELEGPRAAPNTPEAELRAPGLFRQIAVDARRVEDQRGELALGVGPRSWGLLLLLASLVGLLFVGASLASVEVTAQARGILRTPRGLRPVASAIGGSISSMLVQSGDRVERGQVVARLEATDLRASLLNRQRELATTEADVTLAERRDRTIEERASGALERRRGALRERIEINSARLSQRRTQVQNYEELVREGGASQNERLSAKEALQAATESVSLLSAEVAQLDLELADRTRQAEERQSARRLQLSRAQANVEEAQSLFAATEIRAPAAGQLESVVVSAGSVVEPGGLLGNVVPSGAPRTIVAFLPSREIAFVAPGARATIEIQSLPVSEFGLGKALVTRVSSDLATQAEVQAALGEAPATPLVRVELELVPSAASARMDPLLRSGEHVTARLHRRQRRLITLLFDFVRRWVS